MGLKLCNRLKLSGISECLDTQKSFMRTKFREIYRSKTLEKKHFCSLPKKHTIKTRKLQSQNRNMEQQTHERNEQQQRTQIYIAAETIL